jgi:formylmethanofuran dehydrogenase subunit B
LALAEQLGAAIDSATSRRHASAQLAMQAVGEVTCTWGEIAARSDLVICWGADPVTTHPRNLERYSREPKSPFLPRGRADRTLIVVDNERTATAHVADQFIQLRAGGHFDALWTLRALVHGIKFDEAAEGAAIERATGVPLDTWRALVERMKTARYGAILLGDRLEQSPVAHLAIEALLLLVRELNDHTRFVAHGLGSPGNAAGCDEVFTWTTGYPFAVDFRRGYPRYSPDDGSAALLLSRGEVDAVLSIGDDALQELPSEGSKQLVAVSKPGGGATAGLPSSAGRDSALLSELAVAPSFGSMSALKLLQGKLPLIALDWRDTATLSAAAVAFRTAQPGVATGGTVYRSDGVPLALRPAISASVPTEAEVLTALSLRVSELQYSRRIAEQQKAPS